MDEKVPFVFFRYISAQQRMLATSFTLPLQSTQTFWFLFLLFLRKMMLPIRALSWQNGRIYTSGGIISWHSDFYLKIISFPCTERCWLNVTDMHWNIHVNCASICLHIAFSSKFSFRWQMQECKFITQFISGQFVAAVIYHIIYSFRSGIFKRCQNGPNGSQSRMKYEYSSGLSSQSLQIALEYYTIITSLESIKNSKNKNCLFYCGGRCAIRTQ